MIAVVDGLLKFLTNFSAWILYFFHRQTENVKKTLVRKLAQQMSTFIAALHSRRQSVHLNPITELEIFDIMTVRHPFCSRISILTTHERGICKKKTV